MIMTRELGLAIGGRRIAMRRVQNATREPESCRYIELAVEQPRRSRRRGRRRGRRRRGSACVTRVSVWNHPVI